MDSQASLQKNVVALQGQNKDLNTQQTQLHDLMAKLNKQLDSLNAEKTSLQKEDTELAAKNKNLLDAQQGLNTKITALNAKNGDLTSDNEKWSATIDDVKSQFASLKKVLGALDNASVPQAFVDGNVSKPNPTFGIGAVILLAFVGITYGFKHMNARVRFLCFFQSCFRKVSILKS